MKHFVLTSSEDSGTTEGVYETFEQAAARALVVAPARSRASAYAANVIELWDGSECEKSWFRKRVSVYTRGKFNFQASTEEWE